MPRTKRKSIADLMSHHISMDAAIKFAEENGDHMQAGRLRSTRQQANMAGQRRSAWLMFGLKLRQQNPSLSLKAIAAKIEKLPIADGRAFSTVYQALKGTTLGK